MDGAVGEFDIDDQLDGSVCHLPENGEECLGIFSVRTFDCWDDDIQTCVPHASYQQYKSNQYKSSQIKKVMITCQIYKMMKQAW